MEAGALVDVTGTVADPGRAQSNRFQSGIQRPYCLAADLLSQITGSIPLRIRAWFRNR